MTADLKIKVQASQKEIGERQAQVYPGLIIVTGRYESLHVVTYYSQEIGELLV